MVKPDARKLRNEAADALRKGQLPKALARYESLAALEPRDAQWCCRIADVYSRLGDKAREIEALARASDRFAAGGFLLRAIAACKRIVDLDPQHTATQERLAALHAAHGVPAPPPPKLGNDYPKSGPPLAPGTLAEILLEDVAPVPGVPREGIRSLRLDAQPEAAPGRSAVPMPKESDPAAAATAIRMLPRVPLFSELSPSAFQRLVRVVRLVRLREDGVLFREGDLGDALYVVVEGAVVPCAERPTRRRLAVLEEGEFFGEVALVTDQPRIATVRALVETTLLVLDADAVRELIRAEPGLLLVFLRFLRERLIHRLGQTSPLFRGFDAEGLRRFAARFEFLEVQEGTELVSQGEYSPRLYVALCGRYEVSVYDGTRVRTLAWLEPGDVFGEMSAIGGDAAMATVTSRARGFVLALDADRFDALSTAHPPLVAGLRALAAERDRRNEEALHDPADAVRRRVDLV